MKSTATDTLKTVEMKVTQPRKAVLAIMSHSKTPIDVGDIKQALESQKIQIDQATIYRILKMFVEKELVKKVALQEGKTHFELADRPHHHHVICQSCGTIRDVEECSIQNLEQVAEKTTGFSIQSHTLELYGICSSCNT